MGRITGRGWLIGAVLVVAIGAASASAFVYEGRNDTSSAHSEPGSTTATTDRRTTASSTTTTSTSTTTTTTTVPATTTTTAAPPPPTPAPPTQAPAPAPAPTPAPAPAPAPTPIAVTPPPAAAPTCDGGGSAVIDAMNADRAASGLGALCGNSQLNSIAQNWANWMAQNASLTHQNLSSLLGSLPFSTLGENILDGTGSMSASAMEAAWMQSPPHRANILNGAYTAAGVGIAYSSDGRTWAVVDFGG